MFRNAHRKYEKLMDRAEARMVLNSCELRLLRATLNADPSLIIKERVRQQNKILYKDFLLSQYFLIVCCIGVVYCYTVVARYQFRGLARGTSAVDTSRSAERRVRESRTKGWPQTQHTVANF